MFSTSYDALHVTELALYSHRKLGAKSLDIDASIFPFLRSVFTNCTRSITSTRGARRTYQMLIQCIKKELDFPATSTAEFAGSYVY